MIKTMIKIRRNINIETYEQLKSFLKKKNVGYTVKQSKVFTAEEVRNFIQTAPDKSFLIHKVNHSNNTNF